MALLKIISGDIAGTTYAVDAQVRRVGRAQTSDVCVPDISVSSTHCTMSLDAAGNLVLRDLGSTNGTFVEGQRVREAVVANGQRVKLGNLEMVFEGDGPAAVVEPPPLNLPPPPVVTPFNANSRATNPGVPPMGAPVTLENSCSNHPGVAAVAMCAKCGTNNCASCTKQQKVGRNIVHFCARCGSQCKSFADVQKAVAIDATRTKTFGTAVKRAFSYPFRGNGIILLLCGTFFFGVLDLVPGIRMFGLFITVILWGYTFAFMQRIVVTSAAGEDDPPEFPEVTDLYQDIVIPFMQFFVTLAVAIGPGIFALIQLGPLPGTLVLILGMFFYPMSLLGVAMSDSYAALNPIFVLSSIMKVFGHYIVVCLLFAAVIVMRVFLAEEIYEALPIIISHFAFQFVTLVLLMIQMRILGMLYYLNRQKLGWGL